MKSNVLNGQFWRYLISILLLYIGVCSGAGELRLSNGDRLSGSLKSMDSQFLTWQSDAFGELKVQRQLISGVDSANPVIVELQQAPDLDQNKVLRNCLLHSNLDFYTLNCDHGNAIQLSALNSIVAAYPQPVAPQQLVTHSGAISLRMEDERKNTDSQELDLDAKLQMRYGVIRHTLLLDIDTESVDKQKVENKLKADYKFDYFIADNRFIGANAGFERDQYSDLDSKYTLGLGVGYQFFDDEYSALEVEAGLKFLQEQFKSASNGSQLAWSWAADFRWLLDSSRLEIYHQHEITMSTSDTSDADIETTTGLRFPVIDKLSAVVQYEFDYDNKPVDEALDLERTLSFGLIYSW